MSLGSLIGGIILVIIGSVLYYFLLPKTKKSVQKQANIKKILSPISSIFILIGLFGILTFCLGVDGGNYTPEKEDDMNVLNGIIIAICIFSLEKNITHYLQKLKNINYLSKIR